MSLSLSLSWERHKCFSVVSPPPLGGTGWLTWLELGISSPQVSQLGSNNTQQVSLWLTGLPLKAGLVEKDREPWPMSKWFYSPLACWTLEGIFSHVYGGIQLDTGRYRAPPPPPVTPPTPHPTLTGVFKLPDLSASSLQKCIDFQFSYPSPGSHRCFCS